ncbi:MAG: hypothetical protein EZS28_028180 [Streblomastix strix]|uniref:Uncharacterized protein n=1 Tax=Streblomastix strix TaxID=222440 RepID=A0A5J4V183_9EUKA|nr:MAG: hypothetical protein EZS28_028180 [Streblomastix strix]
MENQLMDFELNDSVCYGIELDAIQVLLKLFGGFLPFSVYLSSLGSYGIQSYVTCTVQDDEGEKLFGG